MALFSRPSKAGTLAAPRREAEGRPSRDEGVTIQSTMGGAGNAGAGVGGSYLDNLNQSWKEIEEDEDGNLLLSSSEAKEKRLRERRDKLLTHASTAKRIRRGMIRFVQIVVDLSRASLISDMRPSRLKVISAELENFVRLFFDTNPLSQIGLSCTRNGLARVITELSGSPQKHIDTLKLLGTQKLGLDCAGDCSVQNCLEVSLKQLRDVPPYGHREVLFVMTSLNSCDPGDVFQAIDQAKANKMHCSVVGLGAEVYLMKILAERTNGRYAVATSESHLRQILSDYAPPPPSLAKETPSSLVQMGFPNYATSGGGGDGGGLCFVGHGSDLAKGRAFACPRCKSRVQDLPQACHVCGLSLVSSAHLARSYHHLFPVPLFQEESADLLELSTKGDLRCRGCGKSLVIAGDNGAGNNGAGEKYEVVLKCPKCAGYFCIACDVFIHEDLHNCPGCEEALG